MLACSGELLARSRKAVALRTEPITPGTPIVLALLEHFARSAVAVPRTLIDALDSLIIFKRKAAFKARRKRKSALWIFVLCPAVPGSDFLHPGERPLR